ncbi:MAG: hypothetical protein KGM15_00850 [Pseudomonadota bacterium]|nr:hypothetical protein [Pseudomonadota bacterium]
MDRIVALYWDNIDPRIVKAQAEVFAHFGYAIDQRERTGLNHGDFLDAYMAELGADDVALLMDIDCFPLNREIVERAFAAARAGGIFGCAQSAGHIDPDRLYVAPMFMAIAKRTWEALGRPSFKPDAQNDVAQRLNDAARERGVTIEMLNPFGAVVPKWRLGDVGFYGVGTFYRGGVFHLFESRWTPFAFLLFEVADAVLHDRPIDHAALMARALGARGDPKWARRFARWRKAIWWRRLKQRLGR